MSGIAGAASDARPTPKISFVTKELQPTWHNAIDYLDFFVTGLTALEPGKQAVSPRITVQGRDGKDTVFGFNFSRNSKDPEKIGVFFQVGYFMQLSPLL